MKKILVYNTDEILSKSLKTYLEAKKYSVTIANNWKELEDVIRQKKIDLLIFNLSNPKLEPINTLLKISNNKNITKCPGIIISENGDLNKYEIKNLEHLEIPLNYNLLLNSITRILGKKKTELQEFLGNLPISSLNELKEYILNSEEKISLPKNQTVYKQHKNASNIYLVANGLIKTFKMDEYGKELITGIYKDGDLFGFYSFKNVSIYPETAKALKDSYIYKFPIKTFQEILRKNNEITLEFAQVLADNVSTLKSHMLDLAYSSVLKKTTKTLLLFAESILNGHSQPINLSRRDLASVAGISTESLIRSLAVLKRANLIDIKGRNIKVLDLKKLNCIK